VQSQDCSRWLNIFHQELVASSRENVKRWSKAIADLSGTAHYRQGTSPVKKLVFQKSAAKAIVLRTHPLLLLLDLKVSDLPPRFARFIKLSCDGLNQSKKDRTQSQTLSIKK
jgi:hypothetical protein